MCLETICSSSGFPGFQGIILDDQVFFPRLYRGDRHFGRGAAETRNPRVLTGRLDSGPPPSLPIIKTPRRAKAPIFFRMPQNWPAPPGMTAEGRAGVPGNQLAVFMFPGISGHNTRRSSFFSPTVPRRPSFRAQRSRDPESKRSAEAYGLEAFGAMTKKT